MARNFITIWKFGPQCPKSRPALICGTEILAQVLSWPLHLDSPMVDSIPIEVSSMLWIEPLLKEQNYPHNKSIAISLNHIGIISSKHDRKSIHFSLKVVVST